MIEFKNLTVGELIKTLQTYDPNLIICIENGGFAPPQTTVKMSELGYISGEFYMLNHFRVLKEYFLEDEIPERKRRDYTKCLVINAHATKKEVEDSGL